MRFTWGRQPFTRISCFFILFNFLFFLSLFLVTILTFFYQSSLNMLNNLRNKHTHTYALLTRWLAHGGRELWKSCATTEKEKKLCICVWFRVYRKQTLEKLTWAVHVTRTIKCKMHVLQLRNNRTPCWTPFILSQYVLPINLCIQRTNNDKYAIKKN